MRKVINIVFLMLGFSLLAGCYNINRTQQLPACSTVALISELDNNITYHYVGSSVYANTDFQYAAPQLHPDAILVTPIKEALEKSGYRVVVIHAPARYRFKDDTSNSDHLTFAQQHNVRQLLRGRQVDRVIILTKATSVDYNHPEDQPFGYGYTQRDTILYKGTDVFAAVLIRIARPGDLHVQTTQLAWMEQHVDYDLFAKGEHQVSSLSVSYLNKWLSEKFAPELVVTLKRMGVTLVV